MPPNNRPAAATRALVPAEQVPSLLGMPPASRPFAGVTGTNAPAQNTNIPNLTGGAAANDARDREAA